MLKQRIITALLLGPILLAIVIYGDHQWFALLIVVIQMAATYEWLKINKLNKPLAIFNALVITFFTLYLFDKFALPADHWIGLFGLIWLLAIIWLVNHRWGYDNTSVQSIIKGVLGVLAIMIFAVSMNQLHALPNGEWLTLSLFLLIWVADIGAYVSGKTLGKHKLAINISPGKTWEGVLGAVFFVAIYAWVVSHFLSMIWWQAMVMMMPIALFSVIGDLAASLGKRQAKIKDSSNLLPGHGGFIDRFDSLIAASPLYVYLLPYVL